MFHNNYIRGKVFKDYRSKEMGRYVLDVNGEYSSTTARYFTVQQLNFSGISDQELWRVRGALVDIVDLTNKLNRTLVIPPLKCGKSGIPFCNMCHFERISCFKDVMKRLMYPFKESVVILIMISFVDFLHESTCSFYL